MPGIGACGDNCSVCPRALAGQDKDRLEKVKELWVKTGWRDETSPAEKLACGGCSSENVCAYSILRDCAFAKGYENCGYCSHYPCSIVEEALLFSQNNSRALELCCEEEKEVLVKAFFCKKENLDTIAGSQKS